jgi:hypothetical protein
MRLTDRLGIPSLQTRATVFLGDSARHTYIPECVRPSQAPESSISVAVQPTYLLRRRCLKSPVGKPRDLENALLVIYLPGRIPKKMIPSSIHVIHQMANNPEQED